MTPEQGVFDEAGFNEEGVSIVFALTGVVKAKDLQEINWSVIWMVAGGFGFIQSQPLQ